jgi:L-fuconolactonase
MIVDAHQHFWDLTRADYGWLTPEVGVLYRNYLPKELEPILRESEVAATVLVQAAPSEAETHYLLGLARAHPFVAGVVGWVDFAAADAPRRIAALAQAGGEKLKGLRPMVQDIAAPDWIAQPSLDSAFDAVIAHDLTFDALVRPIHLEPLRTRLLRHPKLRAVLDHAGKPDIARGGLAAWARDLKRLARETPIHCKLSGLLAEAGKRRSIDDLVPYVADVFASFGPDRVMWGSDWPVLNSVSTYADWLDLSGQLIQRFASGRDADVLAKNAIQFYRLTLH